MQLVITSDTHGRHRQVTVPDGDVLIHCGDVCGRTSEASVADFASWFDQQPHPHKLVIAGNHDKHMSAGWFRNARYLQDEGIEIGGLYFYGSPWTPTFYDWYWMKDRGPEIAEVWDRIPDKTDVLITHGPAADTASLSRTVQGIDVGCADLGKAIEKLDLTLHCFGHIHEGYGQCRLSSIDYVNASVCNFSYEPVNAPVIYNILTTIAIAVRSLFAFDNSGVPGFFLYRLATSSTRRRMAGQGNFFLLLLPWVTVSPGQRGNHVTFCQPYIQEFVGLSGDCVR